MFLCMGHSQLSVICTCGSTLAAGWTDGLKGSQAGERESGHEALLSAFV